MNTTKTAPTAETLAANPSFHKQVIKINEAIQAGRLYKFGTIKGGFGEYTFDVLEVDFPKTKYSTLERKFILESVKEMVQTQFTAQSNLEELALTVFGAVINTFDKQKPLILALANGKCGITTIDPAMLPVALRTKSQYSKFIAAVRKSASEHFENDAPFGVAELEAILEKMAQKRTEHN